MKKAVGDSAKIVGYAIIRNASKRKLGPFKNYLIKGLWRLVVTQKK